MARAMDMVLEATNLDGKLIPSNLKTMHFTVNRSNEMATFFIHRPAFPRCYTTPFGVGSNS